MAPPVLKRVGMNTLLSRVSLVALLGLPLGACSGPVDPPAAHRASVSSKTSSPSAPKSTAAAKSSAAPPARSIDLDRDAASLPDPSAPATDFYVWTREGEERTITYHLDATGRPLETLDGIVVATPNGTWQWQVEDWSVA